MKKHLPMTFTDAIFYGPVPLLYLHLVIALIIGLFTMAPLAMLLIAMMVYTVGLFVTLSIGTVVHLILKALNIHSSRVYTWIGFCLPTLFMWQQIYFSMEGLWACALWGTYGALWAYTFANYIIDLKSFQTVSRPEEPLVKGQHNEAN